MQRCVLLETINILSVIHQISAYEGLDIAKCRYLKKGEENWSCSCLSDFRDTDDCRLISVFLRLQPVLLWIAWKILMSSSKMLYLVASFRMWYVLCRPVPVCQTILNFSCQSKLNEAVIELNDRLEVRHGQWSFAAILNRVFSYFSLGTQQEQQWYRPNCAYVVVIQRVVSNPPRKYKIAIRSKIIHNSIHLFPIHFVHSFISIILHTCFL